MTRNIKKTVALVAGAATLLAVGSTTGAVAGSMVTGAQIKNSSVTAADLAPNSVRRSELADGVVNWANFTAFTQYQIKQLAGADGAQGPKGDTGAQGPKGDPGDPASDKLGGLAGQVQSEATPITNIGGSFTTRATQVGTMHLDAGTYLVSASAFFDRLNAANAGAYDGTHLQLAVRGLDGSTWGADYGTCFTGAYPPGDREATCASSRVVTVGDAGMTVDVKAFGYNDDGSSTGSGDYTASVDVSAVKVG